MASVRIGLSWTVWPANASLLRRGRRSGPREGFTLVEALVAFAIIALASVVLQRGLVQSRFGLAVAADREAAEWVARDLLATPLTPTDMQRGGRTGIASGRRFEIRLTPLALAEVASAAPGPETQDRQASPQRGPTPRWIPMRERIVVETAWANGISIETVKLGPVEQGGG